MKSWTEIPSTNSTWLFRWNATSRPSVTFPNCMERSAASSSEKNVRWCKQQGVRVVCIPQRGGTKTPERVAYEKTREFKDGQRFRAGIEGRISVLFRGRGMKRCLAEARERFELWVAAAVLANNLMKIAALLTDRSLRRRKAA